jgi:hypothetical protein
MLTWIEKENATGYIGFDDDCPCYFVKQDGDGWYWEDSWGFGVGGFDTAEEAMAECEKDLPTINPEWTGFTQEELDEIKACMEAHERMEKEGLA